MQLNRSRQALKRMQQLTEKCKLGTHTTEEFFKNLVKFAKELTEEGQLNIHEGLSEEELAIFDLLTKSDMKLNKTQEKQVKKAAKDFLEKLKSEKLTLDWCKRLQTRAQAMISIEQILDEELPEINEEAKFH